jgi:hypothetical protein
VLALGVATKLPFVLVIIPVIFSMFVGFIKGEKGYFKVSFLIVLVSFIFSSIILFYPILPMMPLWPLVWPDVMLIIKHILNLLQEPYKAFLYITSLIVILFFIISKVSISLKNSKYEYKYENLYLRLSLICLSFVFIVPIISLFKGKPYVEIIHFSGNFLPMLGFLVLFFTHNISILKLSVIKHYIAITLLLAVTLKAYTNFINYRDSIIVDNKFSENIQRLLEDSDDVVFYPVSEFKSKDLFFVWSDHRYGDTKALFSDRRESLPFSIDSKLERIHILNERNFFIPEGYFLDKETYIYMKYLQENDYTPNLHKNILSQHLHRLDSKDECTEPYDGFSSGRNFIVIFPKNFELINSDATEDFSNPEIYISNKLMNSWVNKCNYKVDYSVGYFADIKSIFLKVKT